MGGGVQPADRRPRHQRRGGVRAEEARPEHPLLGTGTQTVSAAILAGIVGYMAIIWLVRIVRNGRLWYFSVYLVILGAVVLGIGSLPRGSGDGTPSVSPDGPARAGLRDRILAQRIDPQTVWIAPTPLAAGQILARLTLRRGQLERPRVWTWRDLWREIGRDRFDQPALLSQAGRHAVLRAAIDERRVDGTIDRTAELVRTLGYRRNLLRTFDRWTSRERSRSSNPDLFTDEIECEVWAIYRTYRRLLSELGAEDEEGHAPWAWRSWNPTRRLAGGTSPRRPVRTSPVDPGLLAWIRRDRESNGIGPGHAFRTSGIEPGERCASGSIHLARLPRDGMRAARDALLFSHLWNRTCSNPRIRIIRRRTPHRV